MKRRFVLRFVLTAALATFASTSSFAAEETQAATGSQAAPAAPATAPAPTPEQRKQLAAAHRRMADCLDSDRPFSECHAEMHASCMSTMGAQGCPMMGGGMGMGKGMGMGRGMMRGAPGAGAPTPEQQ
jgi:hypothetical protein